MSAGADGEADDGRAASALRWTGGPPRNRALEATIVTVILSASILSGAGFGLGAIMDATATERPPSIRGWVVAIANRTPFAGLGLLGGGLRSNRSARLAGELP
jgi:hypothetical protein